jgi:hypothetical protein
MKALTALVVIMGMSVASGAATSGEYHKRHVKTGDNYELSRRRPEVRGYLFRPGGHRYAFENDAVPPRITTPPYGDNWVDNRTIFERAMSDPRTDSTSPSAF